MRIRCCYECVPPKRHPGCHATCEEYLKQKAEHDAYKDRENAERRRQDDVTKYDVEKSEWIRKHRRRK